MANRLDAEHWRRRAKEARAIADQLDNAEARWRMLRIACDYEKIAQTAATSVAIEQPEDAGDTNASHER